MQQLLRREFDGVVAHIAHSTRADGDLSPSTVAADVLATRRSQAVPMPWQAVHQVHGDRVLSVSTAAPANEQRPRADALVTSQANLAIAVHAGDCAPVGFVSDAGAVGVAHAGWKGLEAGVLESTTRTLRNGVHGRKLWAVVGPHIHHERYEFSPADLDRLSRRFGPQVAATTDAGTPAFDLTAAIASELERLGVTVTTWSPDCTARDGDKYWSHRDRDEPGRIALVAWLEKVPQ